MKIISKPMRFLWRLARNVLCLTPFTRGLLFPQNSLALQFGRGDAEYAWNVFQHHFRLLSGEGFDVADRILEVGPGRNLGTALLWWTYCKAKGKEVVDITCWDVFRNASPQKEGFWMALASELTESQPAKLEPTLKELLLAVLQNVASGEVQPEIKYQVETLDSLADMAKSGGAHFNLVYSQAAIEHIWFINEFWECMDTLTSAGGWHCHRIDLADHGRRASNYIEMLEWTQLGYWLTMRFIPGATNRWRAGQHLAKLEDLGIKILSEQREVRDQLPIPKWKVASEFRMLDEKELRTTALDVVGIKMPLPC